MQPQGTDPKFDFMLKNDQPVKRGLALPGLSKPVQIAIGSVVAIIILIVVLSLFSSHKNGKFQPLLGVLARGAETLRVTDAATQLQLRDPQTQALAATVTSSLTSDQKQILTYLKGQNVKVATAQLAADTNKASDADLQAALQQNNLDSAYVAYIKDALGRYQTDLVSAAKSVGPNGRAILGQSLAGVNTLLGAPPLKS
jgi:hypothetical protein